MKRAPCLPLQRLLLVHDFVRSRAGDADDAKTGDARKSAGCWEKFEFSEGKLAQRGKPERKLSAEGTHAGVVW